MALSSDTVSVDSSHPTAKPPINYGHHGQDPITLQTAKQQSAYKTRYWLVLVFALIFQGAPIRSTSKFRTTSHKFDSSSCQKHPFYPVYIDPFPFISTMHGRSSRSNGLGIHGTPATPSPEEKTKKRGTLCESPLSDKKTKTSAFLVMDLDLHAKHDGATLSIPQATKKFQFAHQFSEEQAILAATPLKGCYGEGSDFLHDNVKWLKKQLICLLEGTNEIDLNSHPKEGFALPLLATMFSQMIRNQVDDDVVAMTIGEENLAMARILIICMAHSSPKSLWLNEAKNGKIPATQEARYFIAAITAVGPYYKANSKATVGCLYPVG